MDFLNFALTSFTTFFATIGPVEAAVLYAGFTSELARGERRRLAFRAVLIASLILLAFTLFGQLLLVQLGVTLAALKTAGGAILGLIAIDMIFSGPGSRSKLTPKEGEEALHKEDVAVFPMATPLLAGPGAMSAGIVLAARAQGDVLQIAGILAGLGAVLAITLALLLAAPEVGRLLGVTAQRVMMRVFGILLAAIAVQALFDGLQDAGLTR
ncbi:MAG: MarC family protein [Alphaproteobacteria bacterium]|nr:MarC family protein [Alphaproteobacteria bacterium]